MKTSLLTGGLVAGAGMTLVILARRGAAPAPGWLAARGLAALAGLATVPALVAAYFVGRGAWAPLVYNTVTHNIVPGLGLWRKGLWSLAALPALPIVWYVARQLVNQATDTMQGARRAFIMATGAFYFTALNCFWPLVTRQDSLPSIPMAAIFAAPVLVAAGARLRSTRFARVAVLIPAMAGALEVTMALAAEPIWRDATVEQRKFLTEVLRLTRPGESVMDVKGECIFRSRPYYYGLEHMTVARIKLGTIPDDIVAHILLARTAVVSEDSDRYPEGTRAFLNQHYLPVGSLRVAGQWLEPIRGASPRQFEVVIPGAYVLVASHGRVRGQLDGSGYIGPRQLASGSHAYLASSGEDSVAVVWATAVERGFSPFPRRW
jgi:hypothetical protein